MVNPGADEEIDKSCVASNCAQGARHKYKQGLRSQNLCVGWGLL